MIHLHHWQPAFPTTYGYDDEGDSVQFPGVTLLDYFAAAAMQGLLAQNCDDENELGNIQRKPVFGPYGTLTDQTLARHAYMAAKAMMETREESFINQTAIE